MTVVKHWLYNLSLINNYMTGEGGNERNRKLRFFFQSLEKNLHQQDK